MPKLDILSDLRDFCGHIGVYWKAYGGSRAVLTSPFFFLALIITGACYEFWSKGKWEDVVFAAIPCLLGLSIAGMAIVLGFTSSKLFKYLAANGHDSYYMEIAANFVHFTFVQVFSLLFALIGTVHHGSRAVSCCGFFLFVYSVLLALSTVMSLFVLAEISVHPAAVAVIVSPDEPSTAEASRVDAS